MRQPNLTMVTDDSQSLDECILQIFEEQEETFYFPITTQNTARNFIKAMHTKGLSYEVVYKEIGEFEHNFNAWRKGLGRIGIGNRIIERINKPLDDVLLSDDDEELKQILERIKEKDKKETRPENNRVPPIEKQDESKLQRIRESIQRKKQEKKAEEDIAESWQERIDDRVKDIVGSERSSPSLSRTPSSSNSPALSRTPSGRIPGAEFEQVEPGVVDFRSVLKRRQTDDPPAIGDRRSMPASMLLDLNDKSNAKLSGSVDHVNILGNGERKSLLDERNEKFKQRAESEPRSHNVEPHVTDKSIIKEPSEDSSTESKAVRTELLQKSDISTKMIKEVKNLSKAIPDEDLNEEPLPPSATMSQKAPLATEETESSSSMTESTDSSSEEDQEEVTTEKASTDDKVDVQMDESSEEEVTTEKASTDDKVDVEMDESSESSEDINDINYETCSSLNETRDESEESDIEENYDSDLDEDNDDLTKENLQFLKLFAKYKTDLRSQDGPGYIYVFHDSAERATEMRIKIGATRFPEKRLEQARAFNIQIYQKQTFFVSTRKQALSAICKALNRYSLVQGWYHGPIDNILKEISRIAGNFPVETSDC